MQFELVTKNNIHNFEKGEHPFHPAFEYLSAVHKADYLRTYFMHFYGGGYADIKEYSNSWKASFNLLNLSNKICIGYPENREKDIGYVKDFVRIGSGIKINKKMRTCYKELIGNCAYIFKPKTIFTKIWLNECERRLDLVMPALKKNPGKIYGDNLGYPVPWTAILGQIFHPLCFIFRKLIIQNSDLRPFCQDYR